MKRAITAIYEGGVLKPSEKLPTEHPKGEDKQKVEVKHEKIEDKPPTKPTVSDVAVTPPPLDTPPKTEPTTQDIIASVLSFKGPLIFKEKIAARAKCSMDRLNVVLDEIAQKRGVILRGAMVEVL